jgi:hypothetical protein
MRSDFLVEDDVEIKIEMDEESTPNIVEDNDRSFD